MALLVVFGFCFWSLVLGDAAMSDTEQSKDEKPETKDLSVGAILLAAGRSERMGAFKTLLPFGNTTVIESCIDYLKAGGVDTIVVVVGHRDEEVRERLEHSSVIFALNPDPSSEMADSIRCGVEKLPDNVAATLIALVDHPAVASDVVATLIREWKKGSQFIIPTWQGRGGHPVLVDLNFRFELESLGRTSGLKSLFDSNRESVRRIEVSSPYIARDMDTWDDYVRLYSDLFGQAPPARNNNNESPRRTI